MEKFRYEGDALKPLMKVETFKDYKSNAIEFEQYAKRALGAIQGANKKVVDLSDYLNLNSGAVSALREAIALFRKEWGKDDRKLTDEHYEKYGHLLYMMEEGMNMPARDIDTMEGNFLWTYAKEVYKYRDQYVSKFLEDAAIGNDALVLQLNALRDNPEQIIRTGQDWETTLIGANGLAAAMMDAFYDADKVTVSPEQEMNLRRKLEAFTLDFNASLTSQVQTFEKNCKEHFQVIKRLKEAGSEVCGRALTTEDHLYYFQRGIFDSANPSRSTAGFHDLAMEVGQYGVELRKKNGTSFDEKFRRLKGHILALQQIKNAKKLAKRTRERVNNVNGGIGRGGRGRGDGGRGGGPGRGGGGG
ncbi:MAG: hypothetical protein VXU50_05590, partial [Verrucomicrobiota bacterium]|nr:hypothetical protein [Verrucomicrobiota bacterium]